MKFLLRNWHLKMGAVALATVLYTGFVFSGSFTEQDFNGLPIEVINQPSASYPLTQQLGTVDVRYRLAADAPSRVTADSFAVTVDLSDYDMERAPEPQALLINVRPLTEGLQVLDYTPKTVAIALDGIGEREVPVVVERGAVPEGLAIGTPQVSDRTAIATGPESQIGRVERAVARVQIFESGIDVQRQVDLVPVDVDGRQVELVELSPGTVTVEIDVRAVETSKTVPVRAEVVGSVAEGFELTGASAEPQIVTLFGLPEALGAIEEVSTEAISLAGLSADTTFEVELIVPDGTRLSSATEPAIVRVQVEPIVVTRTLVVGVACQGVADGLACLPGQGQLSLIVQGPSAAVAALDPGDVTPFIDASGLEAGEYDLEPLVSLPDGVQLVSISPSTIPVALVAPATPSPAPS